MMIQSITIASLVALLVTLLGSIGQSQVDQQAPNAGAMASASVAAEVGFFQDVKWTDGKIVGIEEVNGQIKKIKFEGKDQHGNQGTHEADADLTDKEANVIRRLHDSEEEGVSIEVHLDGATALYNGSWISYSS